MTWTQLGVHAKPCGLLNVAGFYDGLLSFLEHALARGIPPSDASRDRRQRRGSRSALVDRVIAWQPPLIAKWIERAEA